MLPDMEASASILEDIMVGINESTDPPEPYENWINIEFTNVLDYLSEKQLNFNGSVFIDWVSVPYISIWFARSTKDVNEKFWIMHNKDYTDYIKSIDIKSSRDALFAFGNKWLEGNIDTMRVRTNKNDKITKYGQLLLNVADDNSIWEDQS